jgi:AcrR family transcriptional regulator
MKSPPSRNAAKVAAKTTGRAALQPRRTQLERREATQASLLDATMQCLYDDGYGATSTNLICERAGVSRGALTHHFPTKAALVVAAVTRLMDGMVEALDRDLAAAIAGPDALEAFMAGISRTREGPLFETALEVLVASRREPELREAWNAAGMRMQEVTDAHVTAVARQIRPDDPDKLRAALMQSVILVQGMALNGVLNEHRAEVEVLFESWKEHVRQIAFAGRPVPVAARRGPARRR